METYNYIVSFDNIVESFKESYNETASDRIFDYNSISVCDKRNSYSVYQIQPQADLLVDKNSGISSINDEYVNKINYFIDQSQKKEYDFILTPEYSVPLESVEYLLNNGENNIFEGTLYCLCCQGVKKSDITIFLNKIKEKYDCYLWETSLNHLQHGDLVCCMLYITKVKFFTEKNYFEKIFIIPQFKTTPMKDFEMEFEGDILACGNKICVFGKKNEVKVLGIICSDVFNYNLLEEIKDFSKDNNLILLHPQLNKKPRNHYFNFIRQFYINYSSDKQIKIISINWAQNTCFYFNGTRQKTIDNSWSAVYDKYHDELFNVYRETFDKNARKGLGVAHDNLSVVFFFSSDEHIVEYDIGRILVGQSPLQILKTKPIIVKKYYSYNNYDFCFEEDDLKCLTMIYDFFLENEEFCKLINCKECNKFETNECGECQISQLNEFLASLQNTKSPHQYKICDEGVLSSITGRHYESSLAKEKLYICKKILNKMKNGEVLQKLTMVDFAFNFLVSNINGMIYNVECKINGYSSSLLRVYFLKNSEKSEAEKFYDNIASTFPSAAENIIVYYENEFGIHMYPESQNTNISCGNISENKASIVGGTY